MLTRAMDGPNLDVSGRVLVYSPCVCFSPTSFQCVSVSSHASLSPSLSLSLSWTRLTPRVVKLDLSANRLAALAPLDALTELQYLSLAHNRLTSVADAVRAIGNVHTLILRGNTLVSVRGLERLLGLVRLDVRDNRLAYAGPRLHACGDVDAARVYM
jgi:hypothetical protein